MSDERLFSNSESKYAEKYSSETWKFILIIYFNQFGFCFSSNWLLFAVNGTTDCAEEIDTIQPYNSVAAVEIKAPPNGRILTSGNRRVQQRWHVNLKSVGRIDSEELSNDQ